MAFKSALGTFHLLYCLEKKPFKLFICLFWCYFWVKTLCWITLFMYREEIARDWFLDTINYFIVVIGFIYLSLNVLYLSIEDEKKCYFPSSLKANYLFLFIKNKQDNMFFPFPKLNIPST